MHSLVNSTPPHHHSHPFSSSLTPLISPSSLSLRHAIDTNGSYESQKKETQPFIDYFVSKRLPKFLSTFERALTVNGGQFFVGDKLSYVDLFVAHWLNGVQFQCPEVYEKEAGVNLKKLKETIEKRPKIAERIKQRNPYDGTGPCF